MRARPAGCPPLGLREDRIEGSVDVLALGGHGEEITVVALGLAEGQVHVEGGSLLGRGEGIHRGVISVRLEQGVESIRSPGAAPLPPPGPPAPASAPSDSAKSSATRQSPVCIRLCAPPGGVPSTLCVPEYGVLHSWTPARFPPTTRR